MEGYVQCTLQEELLIARFVEQFKTSTLGKSQWWHLLILRTQMTKYYIFTEFFLIENSVQGALPKELFIVPFVECFNTATLRNFYWEILPVLGIS